MKPLLIIPPAPTRWPALQDLLGDKEPLWLEDIEKRLVSGVADGQDVFAVMPDGGRLVAAACINKRHDIGVLGHVVTRPEHRRRGHARRLIETVISWFDMTGGKWLYLGTTADLAEPLYGRFGFKVIRRAPREPQDGVMMIRSAADVAYDPFGEAGGATTARDATRADWPLIVAMLQHRAGADPRLSLDESAVSAEVSGLELISRHEKQMCHVKIAVRGRLVVGLASVATDQLGERTYAMLLPHDEQLPELRDAVDEIARTKGYVQVDFPMETLAKEAAGADSATGQ